MYHGKESGMILNDVYITEQIEKIGEHGDDALYRIGCMAGIIPAIYTGYYDLTEKDIKRICGFVKQIQKHKERMKHETSEYEH